MTMFRRFLTGLARLSVCLAVTFVTFAGQTAVSTEAAAQTSVRAYVINGTGSGTFKVGDAVAIAASPAPPGYQFARWLVLGGVAANPNAASTTVTANPRSPYVIAIAQRMLVPSPDATYPLTVFLGTGSGSYRAGTVVDVSAPATRGTLVFSSWYDPFKVTADPKSATTKATIPLARSFLYPLYTVSTTPAADVVVSVVGGSGSGTLKAGARAPIAATVPANMVFDKWTSTVPVTFANVNAASTTFVVPNTAVTVTATFKAPPVTLYDVVVTGGRINAGAATGSFIEGSRLNITANAPAAGRVFSRWTGMVTALADATREATVLTVGRTNVTVAATYIDAPVADVRVSVAGGVVVNAIASGNYRPGAIIALRANVVPAGQEFVNWTTTAGTLATPNVATTSFTVPAVAASVTANFRTVVATSDAVALTSHTNNGLIEATGETVFGAAKSPATVDTLEVTLSANGRRQMVQVDRTTGVFAFRTFEGEIAEQQTATLTFARRDISGTTETSVFNLNGTKRAANLAMIAGRLTFGATPALLNQLRTTGLQTWVEQQLNPAAINDAAFMAMQPDNLLRLTVSEPNQLREEIPMWQMAYSAYSQRQLLEVMTFFWNNHFWSNHTDAADVDVGDIAEIRGFRRHAFGRFRDLLGESAKSVSMMAYLDNIFSDANGINQNYARELFELHTVGVNGGYTTADINGAAQAFSGWNIRRTSANGVKPVDYVFEFNPQRHFVRQDRVISYLNLTFPQKATAVAADIAEGEQILDRLAVHPATQEFICTKMVDLLVSDSRPRSLIDRCKAAWETSGGVIAQSLRAILLDPSYPQSVAYIRTKAKTPYEALTASIRNFGVYPVAGKERDFYNRWRSIVRDAGMDMVEFGIPTGFKEAGSNWTNTASFIQKFRGMTSNVRDQTSTGTTRLGTVNYTQMMRDARMPTSEAAAAYLLALTAADRFRKDEYDLVVGALKGAAGAPAFDLNAADAETRLRKAAGLLVTLPSVQLQ